MPIEWQPLVSAIIGAAIIGVLPAYSRSRRPWRKRPWSHSNRYAPIASGRTESCNRADGIKALIKEDLVPRPRTNLCIHRSLVWSRPFRGPAVVRSTEHGGHRYGWRVCFFSPLALLRSWQFSWRDGRSRNKYSLLGAMRAIAQMISYEVPLILSAVTVIMMVGRSRPSKLWSASGYSGWLPDWYVFTPGFAGFFLFMIAAMAESNRRRSNLLRANPRSSLVITLNIPLQVRAFFSWGNTSACSRSAASVSRSSSGDGTRHSHFDLGALLRLVFRETDCLDRGFHLGARTLPRLRMDQLMNSPGNLCCRWL